MSTKKKDDSSTFMPSARSRIRKTREMLPKPDALPTTYGQGEVVLRSSSSHLADIYGTKEFQDEWANDIKFHVARNALHLRRYRQMSQASVAESMGTSQSALARIESAQENITLDTLSRLVGALRGRCYLSIQPSELASLPKRPWWETATGDDPKPWHLIYVALARRTDADRLLIGLQRGSGDWSAQEASIPVYQIEGS